MFQMSLLNHFDRSGNWLFRYRSYVPLILFAIAPVFLYFYEYEFFSFLNLWWFLSCLSVSVLGLCIRVLTVGYAAKNTSGRNTKSGQIAEQLNTKGMYSIMRHPLYFGNFLMWAGIILYVGNFEFFVFFIFFFWIYYERIMFAEEIFLKTKFKEEFTTWSAKTPAFIPKLKNYIKPDVPFSFKNAAKREYHGFYAMVISFTYVYLIKQYFYYNKIVLTLPWIIFISTGTGIYIIIRIIVKTTKLLDAEER